MSHKLEKYYSTFGGIDTRSNKLVSNPKTFRAGSKNFRYNFQDEIQNANGFQHKSIASGFTNMGDIEYKYNDLNTGQEKIEYLCVGSDGLLYQRKSHFLKISNLGAASIYSFYYDEVADTFKFVTDGYAPVNISFTTTLNQLKISLTSVGLVCTVVDDDGNTVAASTQLAYLQDVVIDKPLIIGINTKIHSWFWSAVNYPSQGLSTTQVPFTTTLNYRNSPDYEGISYQNLNNCVYIADGGFLMKYDGKLVYRAGMPKILSPNSYGTANLNGFIASASPTTLGQLTTGKKYKYAYQLGYIDNQGATTLGAYDIGTKFNYISATLGVPFTAVNNVINPIFRALDFPIFSCRVNGPQDISPAGGTFTVSVDHNIRVGMLLRIPVSNALVGLAGYSFLMTRVSAVTATTITVELGISDPTVFVNNPFGYSFNANGFQSGSNIIIVRKYVTGSTTALNPNYDYVNSGVLGMSVSGTGVPNKTYTTSVTINQAGTTDEFKTVGINNSTTTTTGWPPTEQQYSFYQHHTLLVDGQIINGGYAENKFANTIGTPNYTNLWNPEVSFGAFLRIYRSIGDTDNLYKNIDSSISHKYGYTYLDLLSDTDPTNGLSRIALIDSDQGNYLPRSCKYITQWQGQLVQSGRPVDVSILNTPYVGSVSSQYVNVWGYSDESYIGYKYTEADICDYESVYWADTLTPEGFPQDGLHEFRIKTKSADKIKGVAQNKDALFAFKARSTGILVGSLATNDLRLEILEDDIGLASHKSIQEVRGSLVWLDPINGFYSCVAGRLPENIGFPISDYTKINALGLDFNTAASANFRKESLYLCSVGTTTFVYDYADDGNLKRNCWYIWDRINGKSLLATANDELLINDGTTTWKMKITNTKYDFTDHTSAIEFLPITAWLTSGMPTVDKNHINLWVSSVQGGFKLDVIQYGNFTDSQISYYPGLNFPALSNTKKAVKNNFKCAQPKLSAISFGLRHFAKNEWVRIQGYELELSGDIDRGEPKL